MNKEIQGTYLKVFQQLLLDIIELYPLYHSIISRSVKGKLEITRQSRIQRKSVTHVDVNKLYSSKFCPEIDQGHAECRDYILE